MELARENYKNLLENPIESNLVSRAQSEGSDSSEEFGENSP